jgi:hypothetical protein
VSRREVGDISRAIPVALSLALIFVGLREDTSHNSEANARDLKLVSNYGTIPYLTPKYLK